MRALDITVLPGTAWGDEECLHTDPAEQGPYCLGGKLRAIVRAMVVLRVISPMRKRQLLENDRRSTYFIMNFSAGSAVHDRVMHRRLSWLVFYVS